MPMRRFFDSANAPLRMTDLVSQSEICGDGTSYSAIFLSPEGHHFYGKDHTFHGDLAPGAGYGAGRKRSGPLGGTGLAVGNCPGGSGRCPGSAAG